MSTLLAALLQRLGDAATPYTLALSIPYVIAVTAVAAEVAWLAREPGPRRQQVLRSARTALTMSAVAFLVVGFVYGAALGMLWRALSGVRIEALAELWRTQPMLGALAAFVAWDLAGWAYHLVGHRTRLGWAAHQPHHSGTEFDLTLGLRQTWTPFHGLLIFPLVSVAGFELPVVLVCAAFSNGWQVLEHSSVVGRLPRWIEAVVMTPAAHRHHHGVDGAAVNLGPVFTVWDRLAGTWVLPSAPAPVAYGLASPSSPNPVVVEMAGWRELARTRRQRGRLAAWSSNVSGSSAVG